VTRSGHPLPPATRAGYRDADAILVASPHEPALEGVKADLQIAWRIARVHVGSGRDVVVVAPLGEWATDVALDRAFACAASRRARVAAVGTAPEWRGAVARERERRDGMRVEPLGLGETLVRLKERPESLDVVVTEPQLYTGVVDAAVHFTGSGSRVAFGWMQESGPGLFAPGTAEPDDVAGFGVADPTGMLLTAALLLAEGLDRRAAAHTLERAVAAADGRQGRQPRDTRSFTDAVIDLLPEARTDIEHFDEVWR
jgi:isocitrate/isopropylmalate dehydrogenase